MPTTLECRCRNCIFSSYHQDYPGFFVCGQEEVMAVANFPQDVACDHWIGRATDVADIIPKVQGYILASLEEEE